MAVSRGNIINAADFNNLQSRISQLLGTGSQDFGYGQPVQSKQVSAPSSQEAVDADNITSSDINFLRNDINTIHIHQTDSPIVTGLFQGTQGQETNFQNADNADVIGANRSAKEVLVDTQGNYTYVDEDNNKGLNDLINIVSILESNRLTIADGQQEVQIRAADERTSDWNGTIVSAFTVSFSNLDQRRHFFNAGGQIRIEGTVEVPQSDQESLARNQGWKDMIENVGEVQFDQVTTTVVKDDSTVNLPGISFPDGAIGNEDLTDSYQVIFRKDASGGVYGDSYWKIEAKEDNNSTIRFRVVLVDDGPEGDPDFGEDGGVDGGIVEPITADIEFEYSVRRANGVVVVELPAFQVVNTFE